jgi:hypothetical protein
MGLATSKVDLQKINDHQPRLSNLISSHKEIDFTRFVISLIILLISGIAGLLIFFFMM